MHLHETGARMTAFVEEKGWGEQDSSLPQTPRNLAISLSLESAEALEVFQWGEGYDQVRQVDELADVLLSLLQLAKAAEIDLEQAVLKKLETNTNREWPLA